MDYYRNADHTEFPPLTAYRLRGFSYNFIDESLYVEPVSVAEMKAYGYIDFATDDSLISTFITSARQQAEQYLRKSLGIRTVQFMALEVPAKTKLMWGPIESITTEGYTLFGDRLVESGTDITLEFITNASLVNEDIKTAIMAQAYFIYSERGRFQDESKKMFVDGFKEKLSPYRNVSFP